MIAKNVCPHIHRVVSPSVSPTSHPESFHVKTPTPAPHYPPFHPCSLMYILFPASRRADPSTVVALSPPSHPPSPHSLSSPLQPAACSLPQGPSLPAHLSETLPANEGGGYGEQAPMGQLFHVYKTFPDTLLGCTFCQSRAPGGEQQPRERESVRGQRESECERRGGYHFFF